MARNGQLHLVLVDVGSNAVPMLPQVASALQDLVMQKIIKNAKGDHLAVVCYGSATSSNDLYEAAVSNGEAPEYENVEVLHLRKAEDRTMAEELDEEVITYVPGFGQTGQEAIKLVDKLGRRSEADSGPVDLINGIVVAVDMLVREAAVHPTYSKRLTLLSPLVDAVAVETDFWSDVVQKCQQTSIHLEVYALPSPCVAQSEGRAECQRLLDEYAQVAPCRYRELAVPSDILHIVKATEVVNRSTSNMMLDICDGKMRIPVKMCLKTAARATSIMSCQKVVRLASGITHETQRETEYKFAYPDDVAEKEDVEEDGIGMADANINPELLQMLYKYGNDAVDLLGSGANDSQYTAEKGMHLYGFVPRAAVPRHYFMEKTQVLAADSSQVGAVKALSALVRGMDRKGVVGVLRMVPRGRVMIMAVMPMVGNPAAGKADCLLLAQLPFADDIRQVEFNSFSEDRPTCRKELLPETKEEEDKQDELMANLVQQLDLNAGGRQRLLPENTVDPVLHKFMQAVAARQLDSEAQVVDVASELVDSCVRPPDEIWQRAEVQQTLQQLPQLFKRAAPAAAVEQTAPAGEDQGLQQAAFDRQEWIQRIGTARPVDDLHAVLSQAAGRSEVISCALEGVEAAIKELVDSSNGSKLYPKALTALLAMRGAAIEHRGWAAFNKCLQHLDEQFSKSTARKGFWTMLLDAEVTPIHTGECAESDVSAAASANWLQQQRNPVQAAPAAAPVVMKQELDEDDEFADME